MTNAELIAALRICGNYADRDGCDEACPYYNDKDCPKRIMCDAADALEAAEKRIAELEDDLRSGTISDPERFKIYDYSVRDLILFAVMASETMCAKPT